MAVCECKAESLHEKSTDSAMNEVSNPAASLKAYSGVEKVCRPNKLNERSRSFKRVILGNSLFEVEDLRLMHMRL